MSFDSIIAFVNPKSGGQKGKTVLEKFRKHLKEANVFDLTLGGPKLGLEKHKNTNNLRIIACGGDGTVGWVLSVLDEMNLENTPPVAILPLGTGNDLARTLGWGGGYTDESIENILNKVLNSCIVMLDRWSINSVLTSDKEANRYVHQKDALPLNVINNYFSIGADAKIALDFHLSREKNPELFASSIHNKLEYTKDFVQDLIDPSCKNICKKITLFECNGVSYLDKIREKKCHSIVILNIPSYAGGSKPWKNGNYFEPQSYSDGKLEIVGLQISDLMFIQLGGHGSRITQANKIKIVTEEPLPMQVDGEPVMLTGSVINIEIKNQAWMLDINKT